MLSTLPVSLPNHEGLFGNNTFHAFDSLWENQETLFTFPPLNNIEPVESLFQFDDSIIFSMHPDPVLSNSGSKNPNPVLMNPISSSPDEETLNQSPGSPGSGSDEPNRVTCITEDRKQRRKLSNRESAKRSRMRKHQHMENLRNRVTRLVTGNRELMNQLRFLTHNYQLARSENERLRSESNILRQRLWDIRQVMLVRELHHQLSATNLIRSSWPPNNVMTTFMDEQHMMPQLL